MVIVAQPLFFGIKQASLSRFKDGVNLVEVRFEYYFLCL